MSQLLLRAMRPKQWIKNALIFAPLIFSIQLISVQKTLLAVIAFIVFCMLSSAMYLANDIYDLANDRLHPTKRLRPIAAGLISPNVVINAVVVLLSFGFIFAFKIGLPFAAVAFAYVLLVSSYSRWFKKVVILDLICISTGFVLRALAGVEAVGAVISPWLLVSTFFTALFIITGKRRHELLLLGQNASSHRRILGQYSEVFLEHVIQASLTAALISYSLYTITSTTVTAYGLDALVYTIPFVTYGLFRYLYLIYQLDEGGDPTDSLLSDVPLLISIGTWGVIVIAIIYA